MPPTTNSASTRRKWAAITLVALVVLLGMSPWFSASAVARGLIAHWQLSAGEVAWLTMSVQLGFVLGAIASAASNLADRVSARLLIASGSLLAALCTFAIAWIEMRFVAALTLRVLTGAALALVYPVGMKVVASWTQRDRGLGIGIVVLATTVGSATPHLVRAAGAADAWRDVLLFVAGLAALGALLAAGLGQLGPHAARTAPFAWGQVGHALAHRPLRLANFGYLGHMWELYAMWTWVPAFLDSTMPAGAATGAFAVIAAGGLGSVLAGVLADRWGRTRTASLSLAVSGSCALLVGPSALVSPTLALAVCIVWGFAVVADSAQFSASISELADPRFVGTQLTTQTAMGFLLTMVSIQTVPLLAGQLGWGATFATLALGPIFGIWAMARLRRLPEAARLANGLG